ncbi:MAG TPA: chromate efflux transporter [Abditibacterium sp.]|jgi:chromate transporter
MLWELSKIFLRLGATSFGGPLAHIALMREEFVERRNWLSDGEFLDLCGAVNLVPGPNSTELAMHIGHKRAGNAGLWVAGSCFIAPAFVLVLVLAALYARFGVLPHSRAVLWGVAPVVVAIVAHALWKLAPVALKNRFSQLVAALSFAAVALGASEIAIIFAAAFMGAIPLLISHSKNAKPRSFPLFFLAAPVSGVAGATVWPIFWSFLKIGSVIYGSGYVLVAYMRAEFVEHLGVLTDLQLLDAIAIGQLTPGPLFTSATFVGFQIGGFWGAIAATAGIFLPSFGFVMILARGLGKWSESPRARHFLDAVSAGSFALMALVTIQMARAAFFPSHQLDWVAATIGLSAAILLWKVRWNSVWFLILGATLGLVLRKG